MPIIELMFFFTLCVPVPFSGEIVDYDCSWHIVLVEYQGMMVFLRDLYLNPDGEDPLGPNEVVRGLTHRPHKTIYLWAGHETEMSTYGCTVFWHEVLHAYGYQHEQMPVLGVNCSPKTP